MIQAAFTASIRGLPHNPAITEINARSGPATTYDVPFKAIVGTANLSVLDVRPDERNTVFQGKVYQWFLLAFPNGHSAWVRDDLIAIKGDGGAFGYGMVSKEEFAFVFTRQSVAVVTPVGPAPVIAPAPSVPAPAPATPAPVVVAVPVPVITPPAPAPLNDLERVRIAAFNITAGFEGGGYATYQNYDTGIVSYGRFQFTLAGSGLFRVLEKFTSRANSAVASELRATYLERTRNNDANLRQDQRLKQLLIEAANDPIMQAAQDETATEQYWNVVMDLSVKPRNIRTPLGLALIFDMGINFGPRHGFLTLAEQQIGVAPRSRVGENGKSEEALITKLAEVRCDSHYKQAARDNLPGLRVRGDFWVNACIRGDWQLNGDANAEIEIKPGRRVKVRNF